MLAAFKARLAARTTIFPSSLHSLPFTCTLLSLPFLLILLSCHRLPPSPPSPIPLPHKSIRMDCTCYGCDLPNYDRSTTGSAGSTHDLREMVLRPCCDRLHCLKALRVLERAQPGRRIQGSLEGSVTPMKWNGCWLCTGAHAKSRCESFSSRGTCVNSQSHTRELRGSTATCTAALNMSSRLQQSRSSLQCSSSCRQHRHWRRGRYSGQEDTKLLRSTVRAPLQYHIPSKQSLRRCHRTVCLTRIPRVGQVHSPRCIP